jgi:hypothetical protein
MMTYSVLLCEAVGAVVGLSGLTLAGAAPRETATLCRTSFPSLSAAAN